MWLTSLAIVAAADTTPPTSPQEIPYDQIGLVLVAVVGAISAVIVAVIQRGGKTSTPIAPQSLPPPGGFTLSERDWVAVRDGLIRLETTVEIMRTTYKEHNEESDVVHNIFHKDLDYIKRELGIR